MEFSNEVWNGLFKQAKYASAQAKKRWRKEGNARIDWYGMRTAQMCDIWKEIFKEEKPRVICVMSTQTAWEGLEKNALDCLLWVAEGNKPCYKHGITAYGITGYFSGRFNGYPKVIKSWLDEPDGDFQYALEHIKFGTKLPL